MSTGNWLWWLAIASLLGLIVACDLGSQAQLEGWEPGDEAPVLAIRPVDDVEPEEPVTLIDLTEADTIYRIDARAPGYDPEWLLVRSPTGEYFTLQQWNKRAPASRWSRDVAGSTRFMLQSRPLEGSEQAGSERGRGCSTMCEGTACALWCVVICDRAVVDSYLDVELLCEEGPAWRLDREHLRPPVCREGCTDPEPPEMGAGGSGPSSDPSVTDPPERGSAPLTSGEAPSAPAGAPDGLGAGGGATDPAESSDGNSTPDTSSASSSTSSTSSSGASSSASSSSSTSSSGSSSASSSSGAGSSGASSSASGGTAAGGGWR